MKKQIYPNTIFKAIVVIVLFLLLFGVLDTLINITLENCIGIVSFNKISLFTGGLSMLIAVFITKKILEKIHSQKIRLNFKLTKKSVFFNITLMFVFLIIGLMTPLIKMIVSSQNENYQLANPFDDIYYLLGGLLIAPLAEEILFRRIILSGLLTKYNYIVAIFITSLLFALTHYTSLTNVFTAFIFGLFSGYLYYKTNNLMAVVLLHFFNNLMRTFCNYLHYKFGASPVHSFSAIYGEYSVYIISVSLVLFVLLLLKANTTILGNNTK